MEDRKAQYADKFEAYEDYLDSQITDQDMYYLKVGARARSDGDTGCFSRLARV